MSINTILAPLSGGTSDPVTIQTAFQVAASFSAHVEVLFARIPPTEAVPLVGEGVTAGMIEQLMQTAENELLDREAAARECYDAARRALDVDERDVPTPDGRASASWRCDDGRERDVVAVASRLADLVVLSHEGRAFDDARLSATLEAALMGGGKPLLLAPPEPIGEPAGGIGRSVCIAWNGSLQAARAVTGARPFLKRADSVSILTVATSRTDVSVGHRLRQYLAWHGIDAINRPLNAESRSVGETILEATASDGADLLVMGGYTHGRLREMVFGGVTRHVLNHAGIPVLMAH